LSTEPGRGGKSRFARGGGTRRSAARTAGFTLLEIIVVLAILGLSLALFAAYKPPWSTALDLKGTAAELAQQLRLARAEAIARDRPVELTLDLAHHSYRVGGKPARALPPHLAIRMLTIAGERRGPGAAAIRFNPDGSSTGGRIALSDGHRTIDVGVDWLTGRVSVAEAH
jgi:general secretion pathway protein H